MKEGKFNFIAEDLVENKSRSRDCEYRVTLVRSTANVPQEDGTVKPQTSYSIYFPREVISIYDLSGKRIKFFVDPQKKAIGWKIIEKFENIETAGKDWRVIKPHKPGSWISGISKLVNFAKIEIPESRHGLPVKKYMGPGYLQGEPIFYIEL